MTTVNRLFGTVILVILSFGGIERGIAQSDFSERLEPIFLQTPPNNTVNFALPNPSICGLNFPILDNSCTASHQYHILVSGVTPDELGVNIILQEVRIIIEHSWLSDLDITLKSPNNKSVELSTDNGGGADNFGDPTDINCINYTAFNMSACESVTQGSAPFIGSYIPEEDFNIFNDGSDPNGTWILQMCDDAADDDGQLVFVELVFSTVVCDPLTNLTVEGFDSTAVELSWDSGSCLTTIVEYGSPGFIPGTGAAAGGGTVINVSCPVSQPLTITGLSELTEYEVYVRTECTIGGYTQNSCPVNFKTDCTSPPPSHVEDFDAQAPCATNCSASCILSGLWRNSTNDDFDWLVDAGGTVSSQTGPADDITGGGNYLYIETSGSSCQGGNVAALESNCLLIDASSENCHMSFFYHMYGATVNTLNVDISTDEGLNWTTIWTLSGNQGNVWYKAFIDLSAYDGLVAKIRFTGSGGTNFRGDIAIDEIRFYGPLDLGDPSFLYYADNDGDQFGDLNLPLMACAGTPPGGYVDNALDCDDGNASVHPDAPEIPCNALDENCNGPDDDSLLPEPQISGTAACYGFSASLSGTGNLYWFDALMGGSLLFEGNTFDTGALTENATFYVVDSLNSSCTSQRIPVLVTVQDLPDLSTNDMPELCSGESFDLSTIDVIDFNGTNGTLTFHSASPAGPVNELPGPVVSPIADQTYYILSTTAIGCTGELAVAVDVKENPEASIFPSGILQVCKNGSTVVTAFQTGSGFPPFSYEWSTGASTQQAALPAVAPGSLDTYFVTITDANGCTAVDFVAVQTIESITSVSTSTTDVSDCNGNNGAISITPLDGVPPYDISWNGPVSGSVSNISGTYIISNLQQGSYQVQITDSSNPLLNCQVNLPAVLVNGPSAIVTNVGITNVDCNGANSGMIDLTVSGNAPSYLWSNGATTEDLPDVSAGIYAVTITDGPCTNVLSGLEVTEPEEIDFIFESFDVSCAGGSDGSIFISISGGVEPYGILWSNGSTGTDNTDLSAGDYTFTVTDANNCVFESYPVSVEQPSEITVGLVDSTPPGCSTSMDGSADIIVSGGNGGYTFLWNNGAVSEDIDDLGSGTYTVTVSDMNTCTGVMSFDLDAPEALAYTLADSQAPSCNALNDGYLAIEVSGGVLPYTYEWNTGQTTKDISGLEEGSFQLTITDANDCELVTPAFELIAPDQMSISLDLLQNNFCNGQQTGSLEVTVSGGSEPYMYSWSNDATTEDIANLAGGSYLLTVTDNSGCTFVSPEYLIEDNESVGVSLVELFPVSCQGNADGSIHVTASGGLWPYVYEWSNGGSSENLYDLEEGTYYATVTDANNCIAFSDTFYIGEPAGLEIQVVSVENVTCNGFENGSIDVIVSGGTGAYTYSWSNGLTTEDVSGAGEGEYVLTVVDENNCILESEPVQVVAPDAIDILLDSVVHVGCANTIAGSIDIKISGGVQPYMYQWDSGQTTQDLDGIPSGFYSVTVTDENGCTGLLSSIEVEQLNDGFPVEQAEIIAVSCHNAEDGSIEIMLTEGTGPYQYNWSNGVVGTPLNDQLSGGLYKVTVTDDNGCVGESPWLEVSEPDPLIYYAPLIVDNECFGFAEGVIGIDIDGGTPPYDIVWSHGDTGAVINNLPSGIYEFVITDANGCTAASNSGILVDQPNSGLSVDTFNIQHVLCHGETTGAIHLVASGGSGNYDFQWSNGESGPALDFLPGGIYACTVSDFSSCPEEIITVEIFEPESAITVDSAELVDNFYCNDTTGTIALYVSGGTPPYEYFWNNGAETASIENLDEGNYLCTITDYSGCFLNSQAYYIGSPLDNMELDTTSTPDIGGEGNGTATVIISGGNPPFEFQWDESTGSQADSIAIELSMGIYFVTVTDSRNCTKETFVEVASMTAVSQNEIIDRLLLYPNPTAKDIHLALELASTHRIRVEIFGLYGQFIKSFETFDNRFNRQIDLSPLPAGVYFVKIRIGNNLFVSRRIVYAP